MKKYAKSNKSKVTYASIQYEKEKKYLQLIDNIIIDKKMNRILKCVFFIVICIVFILICIAGFILIYKISEKKEATITDIGMIFTAFGGIIGDIIILPKIVAKNLFPENKEKSSQD